MIIDTPWNTQGKIDELKQKGVIAIIRYYNHNNTPTLPEKLLLPEEAQAVAGANLKLAIVFQQRQRKIEDFSFDEGKRAGARAFGYANGTIKQPKGSAIYFSVDEDFIKPAELMAVEKFFNGVRDAFAAAAAGGDSYRVGVYGSGFMLKLLKQKSLAELFWLAQSTGWTGYKEFKESKQWHLLQGPTTKVAGLDVDPNDSNSNLPDFGAFSLNVGPAAVA